MTKDIIEKSHKAISALMVSYIREKVNVKKRIVKKYCRK